MALSGHAATSVETLARDYGAALVLYARQWCETPDDALQEALIAYCQQSPAPERAAAWMFRTVRHKAINMARSESRRRQYHQRAAEQRDPWFEADSDQALVAEEVSAALAGLPHRAREIVVARIWGGLSFAEIAEVVGISASAAHRQFHAACGDLARTLAPFASPFST